MKYRSWQLGIGIIAMILSMLVVMQLKTGLKMSTNLPTRQIPELVKIFKNQELSIKKLEQENIYLRQQLNEYDRDREIIRLKMAAGQIPLTGKGLKIILSDSEYKLKDYEDPSFYVVHYDQLGLLVNELWAAGAEAIAVNGHRIVHTSGFSCAGTTILIDTKRLAPPYEIKAIGDPDNLKNALMMPGGFVEQQILAFNLKFVVEKMDKISIPAYKGSISFDYAQPAEEEE